MLPGRRGEPPAALRNLTKKRFPGLKWLGLGKGDNLHLRFLFAKDLVEKRLTPCRKPAANRFAQLIQHGSFAARCRMWDQWATDIVYALSNALVLEEGVSQPNRPIGREREGKPSVEKVGGKRAISRSSSSGGRSS